MMADTIQTVRWWFDSSKAEQDHLWISWREDPDLILWESIRRNDIEQQLREAFQVTDPLWYGFWINSPLTPTQCQLLSLMLSDVASIRPQYQKKLQPFLDALRRAIVTGESLHVDLAPPGHSDFGFLTTFVHCPRCKADGGFEHWQESYPTEPVTCAICGFSYSPVSTYSSEYEYFATSICCPSCQTEYPIRTFSDEKIQILENRHYYREACEEMNWLERVAEFYRRYPDAEGRIKPHFLWLLDSGDPKVREELNAGVPFNEIELPPGAAPLPVHDWTDEDLKVIEYLQHNDFSLQFRMRGVLESIKLFQHRSEAAFVPCPACGAKLLPTPEESRYP